jgi:hypothetical protein
MPKLSREGESAPLTLGQSLAADICPRSTMVRAPRGVFNRGPQSGRVGSKEGPYDPPVQFIVARPGFGSPSPLSRHKMTAHEAVKQRLDILTSAYLTARSSHPDVRPRRHSPSFMGKHCLRRAERTLVSDLG